MTVRISRVLLAIAASLTACGGGSAAGPSDAQVSAARKAVPAGAKVFALYCGSCHGEHGTAPMAPAVLGPSALRQPELGTLAGLAHYLKRTMPPGKPGSLSDAHYRDVAEYMLRVQRAKR